MSQLMSSPLGIPVYLVLVVFGLAWIGHRGTPRRLRVRIRDWRAEQVWRNMVRGCQVLITAGNRRADARERYREGRL